jgi:hydroxyacyl-ACP dehydratase HTD2-like protein with hotdog domain
MSIIAQRVFKAACWHRPTQSCRRWSSLSNIPDELIQRQLPPIFDYITPIPSLLLQKSLSDFLQKDKPDDFYQDIQEGPLPAAYHLIHFPPATRISSLLPDGTDPLHSPGPPFVRRMWAGGSVDYDLKQPGLLRNGKPAVGTEEIVDVQIKGQEGKEKIYVGIDRKFRTLEQIGEVKSKPVMGEPAVTERRNLVFMREETDPSTKSRVPSKSIKGEQSQSSGFSSLLISPSLSSI